MGLTRQGDLVWGRLGVDPGRSYAIARQTRGKASTFDEKVCGTRYSRGGPRHSDETPSVSSVESTVDTGRRDLRIGNVSWV